MSTDVPSVPTPSQSPAMPALYVGTRRSMGAELRRMQMAGREVVRSQRPRWQRNRLFYLGHQYLRTIGNSVRTLAPVERLPTGRRRDTINRLRQFTDGRIAILTHQPPPGEVDPAGKDQDSLDAARVGTKFIEAMWGVNGWNLQAHYRRLALAGDVDGVAFQNVIFDPLAGDKASIAFTPDGQPIVDRSQLESFQQEDPQGGTLWVEKQIPLGEVVFRVVRCGALSIDPLAEERWEQAGWIIESRVVSRSDIERMAGRKLEDIRRDSAIAMGASDGTSMPAGQTDTGSVSVETQDGGDRVMDRNEAVIKHAAFIKPCTDWPQGGHVEWIDPAPAAPLIAEPWDDDLPYRPYTPKPDGGHFLRSKGTVDDLAPIQARFNRTLSQLGEWLDRVARPPLVLQGGGLSADTPYVFNEEGYVKVNPGFAPPGWMTVPSEPVAVMTQHLQFLVEQMAEVAVVSDASRGTPPGQGVDAAVSLNFLAQSNEQQLSGPAAEFVDSMEWGVSRALKLVGDHYQLPRMVNAPGMDDEAEFEAFTGAALRGANRYRITGSILPRARAAQIQLLLQAAQFSGGRFDITPWISQIVEGDVDEFINHERAQQQRQKRKNHRMAALARLPNADQIWADFQEMQAKYAQALQAFAQMAQAPGVPGAPMIPPQAQLAAKGVHPPALADLLPAGMLPVLEEYDDPAAQQRTLDDWRLSDGFDDAHPLVKQAAHELSQAMIAAIASKVQAMAAQMAPGLGPGLAPQPGQPTPGAATAAPAPASESAAGSEAGGQSNGKAGGGGHQLHVTVGTGPKRILRDSKGRMTGIADGAPEEDGNG